MKIQTGLTLAAFASLHALAVAGTVHDADFILAVINNKLQAGAVDPSTGAVIYPSRIKAATLGAEGFPNFTNDPGFNAEPGMLIPGMRVGFSILRAPRIWDSEHENFDTIATDTITVRAAGQNILAPTTDMVVEGITFGQASLDSAATFHHHMQYLVNGALPPAIDELFLLEIELWSPDSGVQNSDPLFLLFGQGDAVDFMDDAIEYIEDELIGSLCIADLTGDGVLNFFDVSAFLTAFNASDADADLNGDGVFNFFDVSAFLSAFAQGCP